MKPELPSHWLQAVNASTISNPNQLSAIEQGSYSESEFATLLERVTQTAASAAGSNGMETATQLPQLRVIPAKLALEALAQQVPVATYVGNEHAGIRAMTGIGTSTLSAPVTPSIFHAKIEEASAQFGVSARLIDAVIQAESAYNPYAISHAGAKGLMQLMDGTARQLGVVDAFDPQQNIEGGTKFLADLLRKYDGNEAVALAAYNAGPGRIDRLGIVNDEQLHARIEELPIETQGYVSKVLGLVNRE